jgi:hypothetical protein
MVGTNWESSSRVTEEKGCLVWSEREKKWVKSAQDLEAIQKTQKQFDKGRKASCTSTTG